ncbi:MAG: tetratricopeptide repeat protein [Candidatus Aureabacteria bacterium]|nr:tetratricopeptide repeat protein [Candidatus Auribacterota bacterium]
MKKTVLITLFMYLIFSISHDGYSDKKVRRVLIKPQTVQSTGEGSSRSLTTSAWGALLQKKYDSVIKYADKCIKSFSDKAREQQGSLSDFPPKEETFSYWALNDVATCLFIKGRALVEQKKEEEAKDVFEDIIQNYSFAQCWDTGGWFWKVADGARDQLLMMENDIDFGNYTSETLSTSAWDCCSTENYDTAIIYADKCISLYEKIAKEQQKSLKGSPLPRGKAAFQYWALNDVATCYFIKGKILFSTDHKEEARNTFKYIVDNFPHAQCWDIGGWFWSVSDGAKDQILMINEGLDFGDYRSSTLATKAWNALSKGQYRHLEFYADKCIKLYEEEALEQQKSLSSPVPQDETAHQYWALNDVATCYFIKAKGLYNRGRSDDAKKIYEDIAKRFPDAQCWDPRGWFWSVAKGARDHVLMIEQGIDFGDYTSQTLTINAWKSYEVGDMDAAFFYINKCISLYEREAVRQQSGLRDFAPENEAFYYWALNDVGTCYFILGKIYFQQSEFEKALNAFQKLKDEFFYAQCWDPRGWFWKPAIGAQSEISKIQSILASRSEKKTPWLILKTAGAKGSLILKTLKHLCEEGGDSFPKQAT